MKPIKMAMKGQETSLKLDNYNHMEEEVNKHLEKK